MKTADAVIDRIQKRREKLERAGVLLSGIPGMQATALHLWHVDEDGFVTQSCEHVGQGLDLIIVPCGKFMPVPEKVPDDSGHIIDGPMPALFQTPAMWADACADGLVLPDRRIRLIDAPPSPTYPEAVPIDEETINATEGAQSISSARPEDIDRDSVLVDLARHREERAKSKDDTFDRHSKARARTHAERYSQIQAELLASFEAVRLSQQKKDVRPAMKIAAGPTIGADWKGH